MNNKSQPPQFDKLISSPWAKSPENSYYGDPRYVKKEQHGLEDIERAGTKAGNKGEEAALAVIEMINLLRQLD